MNSFWGSPSPPDAARDYSAVADLGAAAEEIKAAADALKEGFARMPVLAQQVQAQIGNAARQMLSGVDYLRTLRPLFGQPGRTAADAGGQVLLPLDQLRQRLAGAELGLWQSRLALARAGAERQIEVEGQTYRSLEDLARETMQAGLSDLADKQAAAESGIRLQRQLAEAEQKLGEVSAAEAAVRERQLLRQAWALNEQSLSQREELAASEPSLRRQAGADETAGYLGYLAQQQELIDAAAADLRRSWEAALKPVAEQLAIFSTEVITRSRPIAKAFDSMIRSLLEDALKASFNSFFMGLLGDTGGGSASEGGGLGLFGGALGSAFKGVLGGIFGGIGNSAWQGVGAALAGGLGTGNTQSDFSSAAGGAAYGGTWLAGLFGGSLFGRLGSALPGAAGGWVVPHFAQGGILSVLHQNEMVLPAHISRGLQSIIAGGGPGGGHTINISAVDAGSVARLFRDNGAALVAALNGAMRHGAMLSPAT